ncbi:YtxH domain-containing protein [Streptococcus plurextorum]|uniref:YtxH domain-containing protein n=1 Tax=Streptococcus plurextorum TaxID=456876 RepID=UPI00041A623F|nr:YtxH domain-containing protein [Streptococcus plurextorum]
MGKFLKTVVVAAATGAATAYFLGTEKGKQLAAQAKAGIDDYKENREAYHQAAKEKVAEYKELATTTYTDYKEKWEDGQFKTDSIGQAVKAAVSQVKDKVNQLTESSTQSQEKAELPKEDTLQEDIIIDLTEEDAL